MQISVLLGEICLDESGDGGEIGLKFQGKNVWANTHGENVINDY